MARISAIITFKHFMAIIKTEDIIIKINYIMGYIINYFNCLNY